MKNTASPRPPVRSRAAMILVFLAAAGMSTGDPGRTPDTEILLADHGVSSYRIVTPSAASEQEEKAARALQDYLLQITGAALPVVAAHQATSPFEIVLGQNERLDELGSDVDFLSLNEDGFVIRTVGSRLVIAGGSGRGTLYGVYAFLEEHLGARMYSPTVKVIPKQERVALGRIDDVQIPAFAYRTTHYRVTWDAEYVDWHRLSHDAEGRRTDWGLWVHTFSRLVPPEVHYADHPEYYAMVDGRRIPTQLCLTNPDVLEVVVRNLRKEIALNPHARYCSAARTTIRPIARATDAGPSTSGKDPLPARFSSS